MASYVYAHTEFGLVVRHSSLCHTMPCHAMPLVVFLLSLVIYVNISVCIYRNVYSFSFRWHFCHLSSYDICSLFLFSLSISLVHMHLSADACCCRSFALLSECMTGEKSKYIPNKEIIFIHIQRTWGWWWSVQFAYMCELRTTA